MTYRPRLPSKYQRFGTKLKVPLNFKSITLQFFRGPFKNKPDIH